VPASKLLANIALDRGQRAYIGKVCVCERERVCVCERERETERQRERVRVGQNERSLLDTHTFTESRVCQSGIQPSATARATTCGAAL